MTLVFTPASELDFETLLNAFNAGYEGYIVPLSLNADQMRHHIEANSIDLVSSRVAWLDGAIVGVALLGRRLSFGWIGGIGVVQSHRGQGIGRKLLQAVIDEAQSTGITRIYLEVIIGNDRAYKLYASLSFKTLRRLLIIGCETLSSSESGQFTVEPITIEQALKHSAQLQAAWKPWQCQPVVYTGSAWGAFRDSELHAYVIGQVSPKRIVFNDVGGDADALRSILLHLHTTQPGVGGTFVNLAEDDPAWPVFAALGYSERMAQYEMALDLA
jgi:GNAT superfamily N-acetyltransferase